jgi:hypothetical protein
MVRVHSTSGGNEMQGWISTDGHVWCQRSTSSSRGLRIETYVAWLSPSEAASLVDRALAGFRTGDIVATEPRFVQAFRVDGDRMAATAINAQLFAQWQPLASRVSRLCVP